MTVRIVIPDDFPPVYTGRPELESLRELGDVQVYTEPADGREKLSRRLRGAPLMVNVRAYTPLDAAMLESLPDLRMIAVFGTGTDNIDLRAAERLGVLVTNAPGANARSVAEHAIGLMFAVARTIPAYDRDLRTGEWRHHRGVELAGKTLGVIGLGNIGRETAHMASGLGMRVLAWTVHPDPARAAAVGAELMSLDQLLLQADVVSLSVALSDQTRAMIGVRELAMMRADAILINTARGALVDEPALVAALQERRIRGAGLDVFATEPLPAENPLRALENVVLTPHAGWVTDEASTRLLKTPVQNIARYLHGEAVNAVNPAALGHPRQAGVRLGE